MPWVRASEMDQVFACPGSLVLPRVPGDQGKSAKAMEAAAWGTALHHWKATGEVVAGEDYPGHEILIRRRVEAQGGPELRERLWPSDPAALHEVSFARSSETGNYAVYQGANSDAWKKAAPPDSETGTADYLGLLLDELWVDDLKTGAWPPRPPEHSIQLRWYALVAWLAADRPPGGVHATITHWPRYPATGAPTRLGPAHFSPSVLLGLSERLSKMYRLHAKGPVRALELYPDPDTCRFCPSRPHCKEAM